MTDIVLSTLGARYAHTALGLRYLHANLGRLKDRAAIQEFVINQRPIDIAEQILAHKPLIVGLGVYIWNIQQTTSLVSILKRVEPSVMIVLGGPEVSHEWDESPIVRAADYLITGEGELAFRDLCNRILDAQAPADKVIRANPLPLDEITLPYGQYDDEDISQRTVYVEASRGCPFRCDFCLSALDAGVRKFSFQPLFDELDKLIRRGAPHLKFVDRTFNLDTSTSVKILEFLLDHVDSGLFVHVEFVPDRLPGELRSILRRFPENTLQLEVGVQTFDPSVAARINRVQKDHQLEQNLRFLLDETNVHVHSDLIVGLPGETLESFRTGFDRLVAIRPHEIQVGILKRLPGAPIKRHDEQWEMVYNPDPPYDVLSTKTIDFPTMQRLRRFSRYFDLVVNSGNFTQSANLIWQDDSPFDGFLAFSDWLFKETGQTHQIALKRLCRFLFEYLTAEVGLESTETADLITRDYTCGGLRRDPPQLLLDQDGQIGKHHRRWEGKGPPRQRRHGEG